MEVTYSAYIIHSYVLFDHHMINSLSRRNATVISMISSQ